MLKINALCFYKKPVVLLFIGLMFSVLSRAQMVPSAPLSYTGASNLVIQYKAFTSGASGNCITLTNCSNVKILNCTFTNVGSYIAIRLSNCTQVEIANCTFDTFMSGVYATGGSGINIHCNSFKTIKGPKPRGQIVQFNGVSGAGNRINYNILEHVLHTGDPEDLINLYNSSGTVADPIQIKGNKLRGGGPSTSGGGIMAGDNGSHDVIVADNILVNPGQYGIAAPSGYNITIQNNLVFAQQQSFTNVGIFVGLQSEVDAGFACVANTIKVLNNKVNWTNKNGIKNGFYNCPCCSGITSSGNNFNDASITASILPATLSLDAAKCPVALSLNSETEEVNQVENNVLTVFPQPFQQETTLTGLVPDQEVLLTLYTQDGKVAEETQLSGQSEWKMGSALRPGVYHLRIQYAHSVHWRKLIKQ